MIIDLEGVGEALPLSLSLRNLLREWSGSCNAMGVFATLSLQSAHPSVLPTFRTSPSSVCLSSPFAHHIGRHQPSRQNCNSFPPSLPFSLPRSSTISLHPPPTRTTRLTARPTTLDGRASEMDFVSPCHYDVSSAVRNVPGPCSAAMPSSLVFTSLLYSGCNP